MEPHPTKNERDPKNYSGCNDDWVTYYGGNQPDRGEAIDVNGGNIYVYGETNTKVLPTITNSSLFPNLSGGKDAFIAKFDSDYEPLWTTYFGGSNTERASDISFNSTGDVYIVGTTQSTDMPVNPTGISIKGASDAFAARIDKGGTTLKWSSYLGGNTNDFGLGIAVNGNDNVFIVGNTESNSQFPVHDKTGAYYQNKLNNMSSGGASDAFILEFDESNEQEWGTYFGGEFTEVFADIEIGSNNDIFLLGNTNTPGNAAQSTPCGVPTLDSGEFPDCIPGGAFNQAYAGAFNNSPANEGDLIIVQFGSNGVLKWSTYLGGNRTERAWSVIGNLKTGKIVVDPSNPNSFAIVGLSNNVAVFPDHEQDGYSQQNVGVSPLLIKFNDRLIGWSTGFTCGGDEPVSKYGLVFGEGGSLYFSANTLCSIPQNNPDYYCQVPTNGAFFPICPPDNNAFFQDNDVLDCDVEDAEHRGGTELYVVCFNPDNELIYSTYFGGAGGEQIGGLAFASKTLFMTGFTASAGNFPLIDPGYPAYFQGVIGAGAQDAFIAGLNMENVFSVNAIDEKSNTFNVSVEPNPTSGQVVLILNHTNVQISIKIYDTSGRVVHDSYEAIVDSRLQLNLSKLNSGLYFAKVVVDGKVYNAKIVRQ
ncbi:MAG: T9SS type A sorting domain-containing protein [Saprospiraceae bacterium]|nr:T9SS type A sorting domain-containing protein [Saprospiraceae bacterium]MCF8249033.1 T9SS type A sorting domain-containing protein [Saprospiraceae bacterium]MCF8282658.1 T9SS type A sorting domain-containing protein [Bacteroidales bacterium]MCF8311055.1 T9SS type A sorting domain-containing protein [Saprospiraceae bacterium]